MKKSLFILGALLLSGGIFAQEKEERKVDSFDRISVTSAIRLEISNGDKESVTVETEENLMKQVKTEVKGGELNLYMDGHFNSEGGVVIRVVAKEIKEIEASGATSVDVKDVIKGETLKLEVSGASKLKTKIKVNRLDLAMSGASHVALSGEADKMKAEVSGAASLKADELKTKDADIAATGAANASIDVSESLNAEASGAGHIRYSGNPKNKSFDAKSAGYIQGQQALSSGRCCHSSCNSENVKMYDSNGNTYTIEKHDKSQEKREKKSR
jgi:hypothetical protein